MRAVQPEECTKHHMMLKDRLDKIDCLLFGCPDKANEIPLATKVNIMFGIMIFLFVSIAGSFFTLVRISMNIGAQVNEMKRLSSVIDNHVNSSEQELMNHETRIIYIERCLAKKDGN